MPAVLVVSAEDHRAEFSKTLLGRADVEWLLERDGDAAFAAACARPPTLVIVALEERGPAQSLVRRLRADERTRPVPVVALLQAPLPPDEAALRAAGADAVLAGAPDPFRWDLVLETLLHAPSRGAVRIPVLFWTWFRLGDDAPLQGRVLNLSERGMLLETRQPVEIGTRIEARLALPGTGQDVTVIGEVVRDAGGSEGRWHYGLVFRSLNEETRRVLEAFLREPRG